MNCSKNRKIRWGFWFFFWFISLICNAQVGELDRYDCNYSKEIIVPYNYSEGSVNNKPLLNQTVFYSYRDQFTYWYRIIAKKNETLTYAVTSLNDSDSYSVYTYQYNNLDFCNKLYYQKIKPLSPSFNANTTNSNLKNSFRKLTLIKNYVYYISVLNTSLNNCGHQLILSYGTDTLKVKALHLPCKKDISSISIVKQVSKQPYKIKDTLTIAIKPKIFKSDTIKPIKVAIETKTTQPAIIKNQQINTDTLIHNTALPITKSGYRRLLCMIKDAKKLNFITTKLIAIDDDTHDELFLINSETGKWSAKIEDNKVYKFKSTAFGYKDLEIKINTSNTNTVELLMEPLKVGDNFIMKSIYFHPNTYALRKESAGELQTLLKYLTDNPEVNIEIQGHTNGDNKIFKNKAYMNLGEEWNFQGSAKKLSLKRAEAIKDYLVNNGIASERLSPNGYGGNKPIIDNPETMEEGQRNIRVEVLILKN
ncbi:MAG: OmpA family protein [Bacteroidota bacterium]|nr:OmpA family protein [Bacteroidota bacterium]